MTEHPVSFSAEEMRAFLDGRKTQTRRPIVKLKGLGKIIELHESNTPGYDWAFRDKRQCWNEISHAQLLAAGPFGDAGDRLWVRECWGSLDADHPRCPDGRKPQPGDRLVYRANPADDYQWGPDRPSQGSFCWRPSIHMPRWASRISLDVIGTKIEQVQDTTEEDAAAEGVRWGTYEPHECRVCARGAFMDVWNAIYAKQGYGWDANPWVWVAEFPKIRGDQ